MERIEFGVVQTSYVIRQVMQIIEMAYIQYFEFRLRNSKGQARPLVQNINFVRNKISFQPSDACAFHLKHCLNIM